MRTGLVLLLLLLTKSGWAQSVATLTPVAHSMTAALLHDTAIEVAYLPPERLPLNRIASWVKRNQSKPQRPFTALVQISALRPALDFYPSLRSANIRIVPIDIAQAILPGGERVALQQADEFFWLNMNNVLVMLGILQRDLSALWPQHQEQINANYQAVNKQLREIALQIDQQLLQQGREAIVNRTRATAPLAASLMLPVMAAEQTEGPGVLLLSNQPEGPGWFVDDFSRFQRTPFIQRWQANLARLQALAQP